MKRTTRLFAVALLGWLGLFVAQAQTVGSLTASDVAVVPTFTSEEASDATYYYIMSAATEMVPGDNAGIPASYFPMPNYNMVLVNSATTESKYRLRAAQYSDTEQFQLVGTSGALKLKNKATGGYMTGSWGSDAAGEAFTYSLISGTTRQYLLRTAGRSPLWVKYSDGEIIADRYNYSSGGAANANKTTAWFFVPAEEMKTKIYMKMNIARNFKDELVVGVHPGQLSAEGYEDFLNKLEEISQSEEMTQATLDAIDAAIDAVATAVNMPEVGGSYYIKSASTPYDGRGYYLNVNENGYPASSMTNLIGAATYVWNLQAAGDDMVLVNEGTASQIQPTTSANVPFTMGETAQPTSFEYVGEGQFKIKSGSAVFHRSNTAGNNYVYNYDGGVNTASAWYIYNTGDEFYQEGLVDLIAQGEGLLAGATVGVNPGQFTSETCATLRALINSAKVTTEYQAAYEALYEGIELFQNSKNQLLLSTEENEYLYYIVSAATHSYCNGLVICGGAAGVQMNFVTKSLDPQKIWKFVDRGNGKVAVQNKASGLYIADPVSNGTSVAPANYSIIDLDFEAQFNIKPDTRNALHCQDNGKLVVNWAGGANTGSAWHLVALTEEEVQSEVGISNIVAAQGRTSTGIGNKDATLISFNVAVEGIKGSTAMKSLTFSLAGSTSMDDIDAVKIYRTTTDYRFRLNDATLLATVEPSTGNIVVTFDEPIDISQGNNYFWITCDVSEEAKEGNQLDARIISCTDINDKEVASTNGNPTYSATIFATQATVLMCGDWGSRYYRIPAIITADDGSLVAVADRRISSNVDLPLHIDVYVNRSTDNGKTWSDPLCVAGDEPGTIGYGDCAILKNKNGRLIILYNGGRRGLWDSTASDPFRKYKVYSDDHGVTWSEPEDITSQLFGEGCTDPIAASWQTMLLTSGVGICTRDGVLMVAVAARDANQTSGFSDYAAVSYDDGDTWYVESANTAWYSGDEAKFVELNNGDIMISMRRGGSRQINTSPDKGKTWRTSYQNTQLISPACNGEILRYTSTLDGYDRNRIIHSLPYAGSRMNVSVMLSYDEGINYPVRKTICPGASAYSALTILPNGNIGCYFEDGGENMDMVFVSFSLDWLTNGADKYSAPTTSISDKSEVSDDFKVWVEEGYIKTNKATDEVEIFTTSGIKMGCNTKLEKGVYLVKYGKTTQTVGVQ